MYTSSYHAPVPELDAKRAMRVVRSRLRSSIDDTFKVRVRFAFTCFALLLLSPFSPLIIHAGRNDWQLCGRPSNGNCACLPRRRRCPCRRSDRTKEVRQKSSNHHNKTLPLLLTKNTRTHIQIAPDLISASLSILSLRWRKGQPTPSPKPTSLARA